MKVFITSSEERSRGIAEVLGGLLGGGSDQSKARRSIMLVRCIDHPSESYHRSTRPVGYPETAAVCGRQGCTNPGLVLLKEDEWSRYRSGETVFKINNNAVKVRVVPFRRSDP